MSGFILSKARMGIRQIIDADKDSAVVTHTELVDNGRGATKPGGSVLTYSVSCRVSYESGGVWKNQPWVGGLSTNFTAYVLAEHDAQIRENDLLEWRGKKFRVLKVSYPQADGGAVCLQAGLQNAEG